MPVFATKSTFERLRLKNKNIVKIDVESEEFEKEYHHQMRLFKNYKWTLAAIPNGLILTYLIPSRYPMTIRGTVGFCVVMLGWWGQQRAAHNRSVDAFKKRLIMDHYESTSNPDTAQKQKAKKLLFGAQYIDAVESEAFDEQIK
eukprot:101761_1